MLFHQASSLSLSEEEEEKELLPHDISIKLSAVSSFFY